MFKLKGPPATMSEAVYRNCHAWGIIIALVLNMLFYVPLIWVEREFAMVDTLFGYLFTQFSATIVLQGLYMGNMCKFLERLPSKRGYRRFHRSPSLNS